MSAIILPREESPLGNAIQSAGQAYNQAYMQRQQALAQQQMLQQQQQSQSAGLQAGLQAGASMPQAMGDLSPDILNTVLSGTPEEAEAAINQLNLPFQVPEGVDAKTFLQGLQFSSQQAQQQQLMNMLGGGGMGGEGGGGFGAQGQVQLSDAQIAALAVTNPKLAEILQSQRDLSAKKLEQVREKSFKFAEPILEGASEKASAATQSNILLDVAAKSVESGKLDPYSGAYWGEVFPSVKKLLPGIEGPESKAFKTAMKEQLVESLKGVSAKGLNQYLEKRIADALPEIGLKKGANLAAIEMLKSINRQKLNEANLAQSMYEEQINRYGYVLPSFNRLYNEQVNKLGQQEAQFLASNLNAIAAGKKPSDAPMPYSTSEVPEGSVLVRSPTGEVGYVSAENAEEYKKLGGEIIQ